MTETETNTLTNPKTRKTLLLIALALLLLWLGIKTWRVATAVSTLRTIQETAPTLLADGPLNIDANAAATTVTDLRRSVVTLRNELGFLLPITPALGWVPRYGTTLAAAPELMAMADSGTAAAAYAFRGLEPALPILQAPGGLESQLPDLLAILQTAQPDLIATAAELDKVAQARASLPDDADLPWRIQSLLPTFDKWLPLAQDGLQLARALPEIAGANGQRTYLFIAQNEDELRATGGFITGAGLLTMANGRIASLEFEDAYWVDNFLEKPYDAPPAVLSDIMGLQMFLFRDANYWPDFPTSAEKMIQLYSYGTDTPEPDGVIAIDQAFVKMLLTATGPVTIPASDTTPETIINANNVSTAVQQAWAPEADTAVNEWVLQRKNFLPDFAAAVRNKLETSLGDMDPALLADQMMTAAAQKHLQIYVRDPAAAAILQAINWDGRLPQNPTYDFLMVTDTNVGYSKANLFVDLAIAYDITLATDSGAIADGSAIATTTVTYTNSAVDIPGDRDEPFCYPQLWYDADPTYLEMADACHVSYLRVYTPPNTTLLDATRHVVPAQNLLVEQSWDNTAVSIPEMPGLNTFANVLLIPHESQQTSTLTYANPAAASTNSDGSHQYRLDIYKQAGTRPFPVTVTITLPPNATAITTSPSAQTTTANNTLTFNLFLDSNHTLLVNYQLP